MHCPRGSVQLVCKTCFVLIPVSSPCTKRAKKTLSANIKGIPETLPIKIPKLLCNNQITISVVTMVDAINTLKGISINGRVEATVKY